MNSKKPSDPTEKELFALETELFEAIKNKDGGALSRLLADDFVYRNPTGPDQKKRAFIRIIETMPMEILAIWSEDMRVRVYGEIAVMTGTQTARVRLAEGGVATGVTAFSDVFVREPDGWRLSLAYGVELPPESTNT
ncbi:MAG: nuclear transport factor 2 family protein [Blastocatellia bacterium]